MHRTSGIQGNPPTDALPRIGHFNGSTSMKKCPGGIIPSRSEADGACDGFAVASVACDRICGTRPSQPPHGVRKVYLGCRKCNECQGLLWYSFCQIQPVGGTNDHRPKGVGGCWTPRWGNPGSFDLDIVHMAALAGALDQPER